MSANPENPAYNAIFESNSVIQNENRCGTLTPFASSVTEHLAKIGFVKETIHTIATSQTPPWQVMEPLVNLTLSQYKKADTNPLVYKSLFLEMCEAYSNFVQLFTDGSKDGEKVSCAVVTPSFTYSQRLPGELSIFSAELHAIRVAVDFCEMSDKEDFVIFCDSKSVLQALESKQNHPYINPIVEKIEKITGRKTVVLCWVPSHIGIQGNELADAAAKTALGKDIEEVYIPQSDLRAVTGRYIQELWQEKWDKCSDSKLYEIKPNLSEHVFVSKLCRKQQVVLTRLRLGHTYITHSHLMKRESVQQCDACKCPITTRHILLYCTKYRYQRTMFLCDMPSVKDIFNKISTCDILSFIHACGLSNQI